MNPKIICVPYSGSEGDDVALEYAFDLAESYQAKVDGWHIMPNPELITLPVLVYASMPYYPEEEIENVRKIAREKQKKAEKKFLELTKKIVVHSAFHIVKGNYGSVLSEGARLADLIVIPRTEENISWTDTASGALFGTGRPVLFVSPRSPYKKFNGKVLIAWDGGKQAASAVVAALPYLLHNKVSIFTAEEKGKELPVSAMDLKIYLEAHNIRADILPPLEGKSSIPVSIINSAKTLDCGLIVCGAWGHSRAREFLLGGVTDHMLNHSDIPFFMVH